MIGLILILAIAAAALAVSRWRRVPSVPVLLLFGVGLSASGWAAELGGLDDLLILGLMFLVFSAGTELDPHRFSKRWKAWVGVGLIQFLCLAGAGIGTGHLLGLSWLASLYLGLGLAASSTLVVVGLLQGREQVYEPYGRLVLGVLLIQDLLVIVALILLSHLDAGGLGMLSALGKGMVLVGLAWVVTRLLTPRVLAASALDDEFLLLYLLAVLFAFVGVAFALNLPLVAGAFWAGVGLTGFPVHGLIRGQLQSLSNFFSAIFFVALGAAVPLPGWSELVPVVVLSLLVILLTPPLVTVLAERFGMTTRSGVEAGLMLSQTSEFSIILGLLGLRLGHVNDGLVAILGWVTILTMLLTPFLTTNRMAWRLMRLHPSRWQAVPDTAPAGHLLLIGAGETGNQLLETISSRFQKTLIIDEDPLVVERLRHAGYEAIRGDGADYRVLQAAGVKTARVVVSTMGRVKDHKAILKRAGRGIPVLCRVFEDEEADQVRRRGGIPVLISRVASDDFLAWFDRYFAEGRSSR